MSDTVTNIESQPKKTEEYADLITRLLTETYQMQQRDCDAGYEHGVIYAQHMATPDEFVALEEIVRDARADRHFTVYDLAYNSNTPESVSDCVGNYMCHSGVIYPEIFWLGWFAGFLSVRAEVKHAL